MTGTGARRVLADAFGRPVHVLRAALEGTDVVARAWRPAPGATTLGWLAWHVARVQDAQVAALAGVEEAWTADGWAERFALPQPPVVARTTASTGRVDAPLGLLFGYLDAATGRTLAYLERVDDDDLDTVVDESWDPPVMLGVRLVSVLDDCLAHAGQAAYVRGLLDRALD